MLQENRELITSFAESVGIQKLEKDIQDLLCSDLESKMLEIIQVRIRHELYFNRKQRNL